jgi:hypothetical protein
MHETQLLSKGVSHIVEVVQSDEFYHFVDGRMLKVVG